MTRVRTLVTCKVSPGVCCPVSGFSSGVDDPDDVTEESVLLCVPWHEEELLQFG